MRRGYSYAARKRSVKKGAELRGVEVWLRRYRRGWRILERAYWREHHERVDVCNLDHTSAWWVAFSELEFCLEKLAVKRADLHMGNESGGNVIAFPPLTGRLFSKE